MYSPVAGSAYGSQIRKSHIIFSGFTLMEQVGITPMVAIKDCSLLSASSTAYTAVSVSLKDLFPQCLELVRFDVLLILLIEGFLLFSLFSLLLFPTGIPFFFYIFNVSQVVENQNLFIFILKIRMSRNNILNPKENHTQ